MSDRPRIEDPYTGEDLGPADPSQIAAVPLETGYDGTKPNPVYNGLPHFWLFIDAQGEIRSVAGKSGPEVDEDDRDAVHRAIFARMRRRSPDGLGSGGVTLRAPTRIGNMRKPAADCSGPALGATLSHVTAREAAHDGAHTHETNRSHTRGNRMTAALNPKPADARPVLTLYDLSDRLLAIEAFIDENADVIIAAKGDLDAIPGLVDALEQLEGEFTAKVERVALFIENRTALGKARAEQAEKFARMAAVDTNVVASLKAYLVRCQRRAGKIKIETPSIVSRIQRNGQQSIDRRADAQTLEALHDAASVGFLSVAGVDGDDFRAAIVECIAKEIPPPIYSLNREKILEIWKAAYQLARNEPSGPASRMTDFDADQYAQAAANGDPVLRTLGVTVTQGYHVRLK